MAYSYSSENYFSKNHVISSVHLESYSGRDKVNPMNFMIRLAASQAFDEDRTAHYTMLLLHM